MSHPTDMHHNPSLPMQLPAEVGNPVRRGDTVTNIDPLGNIVPEHGGYTVAPGLAARAAKEAEAPKPAASDALAEDAAPPEFPPGCPEFRPLHRLSFLDKAAAFELFDAVEEIGRSGGLPKKGESVSGRQAATMYRALARIDDFLMFVSVDKDAYANWEGRHNDTMFSQTWAAYQARMQPGEAVGSSS